MATLQIDIPNNKVDILKAALGYQDTIINEAGEEIANPQSAKDFAENWIIDQLKRQVKNYEKRQALNAAVFTDVGLTQTEGQ